MILELTGISAHLHKNSRNFSFVYTFRKFERYTHEKTNSSINHSYGYYPGL